jgi:transcriptional regulator with XRE-family HTH domain
MSDLRQDLKAEFEDPEYRYAYAESFLNTKLATQIKILREQRQKTQTELGAVVGTKQSGFSRFEDVNHSVWKTDTLWKIARALDVRLDVAFKTFGSMVDDKEHFTKEAMQCPDFEHDPAFAELTAARVGQPSPARRNRRRIHSGDGRRHRPRIAAVGPQGVGGVSGINGGIISSASSYGAALDSILGTKAMQGVI